MDRNHGDHASTWDVVANATSLHRRSADTRERGWYVGARGMSAKCHKQTSRLLSLTAQWPASSSSCRRAPSRAVKPKPREPTLPSECVNPIQLLTQGCAGNRVPRALSMSAKCQKQTFTDCSALALITTSMVKARWISSVKKPVAELMGVTNNAATYDTHSVCGADGTRSTRTDGTRSTLRDDTRVTRQRVTSLS